MTTITYIDPRPLAENQIVCIDLYNSNTKERGSIILDFKWGRVMLKDNTMHTVSDFDMPKELKLQTDILDYIENLLNI